MSALLIIALGIVNWFATTLIVESEIMRPLRDGVSKLGDWSYKRREGAKRHASLLLWRSIAYAFDRARYLVGCHMCTGTWVGFALVPLAPALFGSGWVTYIVMALLIRGIGHLILVLVNWANARHHDDSESYYEIPPSVFATEFPRD